MPELPEVQAVVNSLKPLTGSRITAAQIRRQDITRQIDPAITTALPARTITAITRRGKLILFHLDNQACFTVHLGMSGRLVIDDTTQPHTHLILPLTQHRRQSTLAFVDPRRFGKVRLTPDDSLAPEPLDITLPDLTHRLSQTSRAIKPALLDQRRLVAGLGNIYTDEILHAARIHPSTPASQIPQKSIARLLTEMHRILTAAIAAKGSTLKDAQYTNALGEQGSFQTAHKVYARSGHPCLTCKKDTIQSFQLHQRTTTFCPTCQPRRPAH
jgi:formamidopyrimidine-DNA glycosylase